MQETQPMEFDISRQIREELQNPKGFNSIDVIPEHEGNRESKELASHRVNKQGTLEDDFLKRSLDQDELSNNLGTLNQMLHKEGSNPDQKSYTSLPQVNYGKDSARNHAHEFSENQSVQRSNQDKEIPERALKNKVYYFFWLISNHAVFNIGILLCILSNTVVLALDRYPISKEEDETLELINEIFAYIFFVEMIIKLIGLGPKMYVYDRFNLFDAFLVILTMIESVLQYIELAVDRSLTTGGAFSAFRAIRLLRVFKIARSWPSFQIIMGKIGKSLVDISTFSILLFIFIYISALLGMELFAHNVKYNEEGQVMKIGGSSRRANFDDFIHAFTTVFIIIIGDVRVTL